MALDILRSFARLAEDIVHQPRHDLESIVYVLVWICILYPGPGHEPSSAHDTCLSTWVSCKTRRDIVNLWSTKTGELTTLVPTLELMPYFGGLADCITKLYKAIRTKSLDHRFLRETLLDAFFELHEAAPSHPKIVRKMGAVIPAKRRSLNPEAQTSKRARRH